MNNFEIKVLDTVKHYNMLENGDSVLVGLSGGADSCSLLYVLKVLAETIGIKLYCAHLNHGIRGDEAQRDMNFAKKFAAELDVPIVCETFDVPKYAKEYKLSEETAGRNLRYDFFNRVSANFGCNKIAVAHNKNDRAETILMNMIRGCGSNGFRGIKPVNKNVIRPLIDVSRNEIEEYITANGINYVTDSTNNENIYARNKIRNKVLAELVELNPKALDNIIRTSDIICHENNSAVELLLSSCSLSKVKDSIVIKKNEFEKLSNIQKKQILLNGIMQLGYSLENITHAQLENALSTSGTGKSIKLGSRINVLYTSDSIIISDTAFVKHEYEYSIIDEGTYNIKEINCSYSFEYVDSYKKEKNVVYIAADNFVISQLKLRTRREGDVFVPSGLTGSKKVKKFFIDMKIPSHERDFYPLLVLNDEILAILPLRVNDKYRVVDTTEKILKITFCGGTYDEQ